MMHMRGNPQNMRSLTAYEDILLEIIDYFQQKIDKLTEMGVKDIIIDPGFGFAKTIAQNYELLKKLNYFTILNLPLLVGLSRKSLVYKKLGIDIEDALNGTSILNTIALVQGASILRVHDVKEAVQAIKLYKLTYG
jgi:dihydropteroate synthase